MKFLGVSPGQYIQMRRLNLVRSDLRRADPTTVTVAQIAQRYKFSELERFAVAYLALFGEPPSETLRRCHANLS